MVPEASFIERFAAGLDRLSPPEDRIGLAVSGGPDSVALLLLAAAARSGNIEAATVDHRLRPESAAEAAFVADLCGRLGVPHRTLTVEWQQKPATAIQEQARAQRYALLAGWVRERSLSALCTGHHRDDQAETLLMRLVRGAGVRGLAAMRSSAPLPGDPDLRLLRPLLGWARSELLALCVGAAVTPIEDPSNEDGAFERVRVRRWLQEEGMGTAALARSAANLADADDAIAWAADREWTEAVTHSGQALVYSPGLAPMEIRRRIAARAIAMMGKEGAGELRGGELDRLIGTLDSGGTATLRGVLARGGDAWRFSPAPPRSSSCG